MEWDNASKSASIVQLISLETLWIWYNRGYENTFFFKWSKSQTISEPDLSRVYQNLANTENIVESTHPLGEYVVKS